MMTTKRREFDHMFISERNDFVGIVLSVCWACACFAVVLHFPLSEISINGATPWLSVYILCSTAAISLLIAAAGLLFAGEVFRQLDGQATSSGLPVQPFDQAPAPKKTLMDKRIDSCLVIINGGIYDVEPLMRTHPGGRQVLENARGLDVSDAFMSYHPPAVVLKKLPGYFVGPSCASTDKTETLPGLQGAEAATIRTVAISPTSAIGDDASSTASPLPEIDDVSVAIPDEESKSADSDCEDCLSEDTGSDSSTVRRRRDGSGRPPQRLEPGETHIEPVLSCEGAAGSDNPNSERLPKDPTPLADSPFLRARRALRDRMLAEGLFERKPSFYVKNIAWQVLLLSGALYLTVFRASVWEHLLGAVLMAFFWQQVAFVGHDLGHNSVSHDRDTDFFWGALLGNASGGISMGWWKDSHDVHHVYCNSNEHDMNIQHQPVFAVDESMFGRYWSTYKKMWIETGAAARFLVQYQHWLYLPVMAVARFNLYAQGIKFLLRAERAEYRRMELGAIAVFVGWFGAMVALCLGSWQERLAYLLLSHGISGILHVQITLSHFAEPTYHGSPFQGESDEWFRMQVGTTLNVDCPEWMDWFHGGLQFQIEHHLFPRMPRHNLRRARAMVKPFCEEHGIEYKELPFLQAVGRVLAKMKETGAKAAHLVKGDAGFYHSPLYAGLHAQG